MGTDTLDAGKRDFEEAPGETHGASSLSPPKMFLPTKRCKGPCRRTLPIEGGYRRDSRSPDGHQGVCKTCRSAQDRIQKLRKRYGLSPAQYAEMHFKQGGRCLICRKRRKLRLEVDHDHDTGKVRGLLCGECNRSLGLLREDPETAARAALYLARNQTGGL